MRAARIAVLVGREPAERYSLHRGYADALWEVGAHPLVLTPPPRPAGPGPDAHLERYLEAVRACDGICVTGGGDVDPARYGESPAPGLMDLDPRRDTAEIEAVRAARAAGQPVLGICRGIQVIAVATGGTLHQDLGVAGYPGHWDEARQYEPVHPVELEPGSLAAKVFGPAATVNSIHHQAVSGVGDAVTVTGRAPDGVVEAIEGPGLLAVQWHPERLYRSDPAALAPFRWLAGT